MESRMNSRARTGVLVPTYNRARYIEECLTSLLQQTLPPDEVFVIDDGSTDDTAQRVAAFGSRVGYVRTPNRGKSCALNLGLDRVEADYYWLFDDDDVALPDALARLMDALQREPAADFAYSGQIVGAEDAQGKLRRQHTVNPFAGAQRLVFHRAMSEFPFRLQGVLMRRHCFDAAGRFDPRFLRSQDYEFILRMLQHCRGVRLDGPTFVWREHTGARGPGLVAHESARRVQVWMEFDGLLGGELRERLALQDFLPEVPHTLPLDVGGQRLALVHRLAVMASKGLVDEMAADLREAAGLGKGLPGTPTAAEADVLRRCATHRYFLMRLLSEPKRVVALLRSAGRGPFGRGARLQLARGILWSVRHADLCPRNRWMLTWSAVRLAVPVSRALQTEGGPVNE